MSSTARDAEDLRILASVVRDAREHTARHATTSKAWEGLRRILRYDGSSDALNRDVRRRARRAVSQQPNPRFGPVRAQANSGFAVVILQEHDPVEVSTRPSRAEADALLEERLRDLAPDVDTGRELDVWALREEWEDRDGNYAIVHEVSTLPPQG